MGEHSEMAEDGSSVLVVKSNLKKPTVGPVKTNRVKQIEKEAEEKEKRVLTREDGEILVEFISEALLQLSNIVSKMFENDAGELISVFRDAIKAERRVKPHSVGSLRAAMCSQVFLGALSDNVKLKLRGSDEVRDADYLTALSIALDITFSSPENLPLDEVTHKTMMTFARREVGNASSLRVDLGAFLRGAWSLRQQMRNPSHHLVSSILRRIMEREAAKMEKEHKDKRRLQELSKRRRGR